MSHLHAEERPQVMKIRHNLQLNIPQPGATPHKVGSCDAPPGQLPPSHPRALPPLTAILLLFTGSSRKRNTTSHCTPSNLTSFLCFLRSATATTKPYEENQDYRQKTNKQKKSSKQLKTSRVKSRGLQTDSANASQGEQGSTEGLATKVPAVLLAVLTSKPVSTGRSRHCAVTVWT